MAYCSRYFTEFHLLKQLLTVISWHEHCYPSNQTNSCLWNWDQNCVGTNCWCSCLIWPCLCVIMYFPSQSDIYSGVHPMMNFQCTKTKLGRLILHILEYNDLKVDENWTHSFCVNETNVVDRSGRTPCIAYLGVELSKSSFER